MTSLSLKGDKYYVNREGGCLPFHFATQETYTTDNLQFCE